MIFKITLTRLLLAALTLLFCAQTFAARTTTYYHTDGLGSVVAATNEAGTVLWRKDYAPFGAQIDTTPETERTAYTGKQHDEITGLTYFGARYFDPEIGRFMSVDPVGFVEDNPMSFNRYLYVNNNPFKYVDPDGEFLNFAAKFVLDVGINIAFNYLTTGEMNVGGALKESALGIFNPAKSLAKGGELVAFAAKARKTQKAAEKTAAKVNSRTKNHHREASEAEGRPHSSYRTDGDGKVTSYETYNYPSPGSGRRVDVTGTPHNGVPTPHVTDTTKHVNPRDPSKFGYTEGPTRPARPDEIPRQ